tara:strand:- start:169 stop:1068 length:900 start_codon:yes stop_codon:yes gene_type:complete
MKILITGSEGFLGKNLTNFLASQGYEIIKTDLNSIENQGSISNKDFVFNTLSKIDFDNIIHLGAIANIKETCDNPFLCYDVNCNGTLNLLELAKLKKITRFIYMSSANVYGNPSNLPVTETHPLKPRLPYDYSKVISENLVTSYNNNFNLSTTIIRSWKIFGEYEKFSAAIPKFIKLCLNNEPIPLYNSGIEVTDPYYVENYCRAIELCLKKEEAIGECFNLSGENKMSVKDIASAIKKITNSDSELQILPPRSQFEIKPMKSYSSISKIKNLLNYELSVSFEEGIKSTVDWIKNLSDM